VDDGSTDRTSDIVLWYRRKTSRVKLFTIPHRGKGSAVRYGVAHAHGEFVFLCDADLKDGVTQLDKLETALMAGADVAIGSRWVEKSVGIETQPRYRRVSSRVFNFCAHNLLGLHFKDTQCGLKAFTREAAQTLFEHQSIEGWGFDPELLLLAHRFGFNVAEVPIELAHDYATSRFRPVRDGIVTFKELFSIIVRDAVGAYPRTIAARNAEIPAELSPVTTTGQEAA
jgi:glycosyltransferase involved in cell wall biosynthesis